MHLCSSHWFHAIDNYKNSIHQKKNQCIIVKQWSHCEMQAESWATIESQKVEHKKACSVCKLIVIQNSKIFTALLWICEQVPLHRFLNDIEPTPKIKSWDQRPKNFERKKSCSTANKEQGCGCTTMVDNVSDHIGLQQHASTILTNDWMRKMHL